MTDRRQHDVERKPADVHTLDALDLRGARLAHRWYPPGLWQPPHAHAQATVTLVLSGALDECQGGRTHAVGPGWAVVKPAGVVHSDRFSAAGARVFAVELTPDLLAPFDWRPPDGYGWAFSSRLGAALASLYRGSRPGAGVEAPALDEALVLVAGLMSTGGARPIARPAPRWMARARDVIHARFAEPLRVREVAATLGLHPVYLTRAFHQTFHCTVTDYIRRLRIDAAADLLASTTRAIADIALEVGFADQAHLSRAFRVEVGLTPGGFRRDVGHRRR